MDLRKVRLVAKGYTKIYGSDYYDTFFLVTKIASVRLLLSMVAMRSWPMYQLDIMSEFLHGKKLDRLKMCHIKCVRLYVQVHASYQVVKR